MTEWLNSLTKLCNPAFPMRDNLNLTHAWLTEKLAAPEQWSVRDRDDIVYVIEEKRRELSKTPKHHQPMRQAREEALAALEAAMERYIQSEARPTWHDSY